MKKSTSETLIVLATATIFAMLLVPRLMAATAPVTDSVEIVPAEGERDFRISVPKGDRTARGFIVRNGAKKVVKVSIKVDQDGGSISWKE
jgi:hypothetical protein